MLAREEAQPPCICPVIRALQAHVGRWKDSTLRRTSRWSVCSRCLAWMLTSFLEDLGSEGPAEDPLLPPVESAHEVWASGVTYLRSRRPRAGVDGRRRLREGLRRRAAELFFKAWGGGSWDTETACASAKTAIGTCPSPASPGCQQRDGDRRLHRGQRRVLADMRARTTVSPAGQGLRRRLLSGPGIVLSDPTPCGTSASP